MPDSYSTYEAKARFSEVLRKVREGRTVIVSYHGKPIAEIRPYQPEGEDLSTRLDRLAGEGVLMRAPEGAASLGLVRRKKGALKRFLSERDE